MLDYFKKLFSDSEAKEMSHDKQGLAPSVVLAVLLIEAAHSDGECSEQEKKKLTQTLIDTYTLSPDEVESLLEDGYAKRKDAIDLFQFTRYLNNNFSREEKIELLVSVWQIILIDDHLEAHEDHFVHKLANLLRLTHKDLIDAKQSARALLK